MTIHIKTWSGAGSATIIDMTNAGKRGKTCRTFRFSGWLPSCSYQDETPAAKAGRLTNSVLWFLEKDCTPDMDYDDVTGIVAMMVNAEKTSSVNYYDDETIKGIDAPKPLLSAGVEGKWGGSADETGISLSDHSDPWNWPASITYKQTPAKAYSIASKVWDKVKEAKTFSEAQNILSAAGCKLHYFCRMD